MSIEQYFGMIGILIRVLILVAFILVFMYIVYCEGRGITSESKSAKEVKKTSS